MRRVLRLAALLAAVVSTPARAADPTLDGLAEQIARLRSEIEALDSTLEEKKEHRRSQLRALGAQRSTVEAELQREELRQRQLAERLERSEERARTVAERQAALGRAVIAAAATLKASLATGIPFQLEERGGELDAIAKEVEAGTLPASGGLARLWAWVDMELQLARGNGVHQQALALGDREVLADVARIGMVALYFRAPGDQVGAARLHDGKWTWEVLDAPQDHERIQSLFAAMEKDVRVGFFELPGAVHAALARGE